MGVTAQERRHVASMLALTFSTGVVDAVGFLGLDRVFTGNMTGNLAILGMGLTGAEGLPTLGPLLALGAFMLGATIGGRALRRRTAGWTGRVTFLFGLVTTALAGIAVALVLIEDLQRHHALAITTCLGAAMGLQAAVARFVAVSDVTTVALTSTVIGFAADSSLGGGRPGNGARRFGAISCLVGGAAVGALTLRIHPAVGVALAATICAAVTTDGWARRRVRRASGRSHTARSPRRRPH